MKKAKKEEGECCKRLDRVLQELHIHRQQYHGGSFVGNHIHKMLQVCTVTGDPDTASHIYVDVDLSRYKRAE